VQLHEQRRCPPERRAKAPSHRSSQGGTRMGRSRGIVSPSDLGEVLEEVRVIDLYSMSHPRNDHAGSRHSPALGPRNDDLHDRRQRELRRHDWPQRHMPEGEWKVDCGRETGCGTAGAPVRALGPVARLPALGRPARSEWRTRPPQKPLPRPCARFRRRGRGECMLGRATAPRQSASRPAPRTDHLSGGGAVEL